MIYTLFFLSKRKLKPYLKQLRIAPYTISMLTCMNSKSVFGIPYQQQTEIWKSINIKVLFTSFFPHNVRIAGKLYKAHQTRTTNLFRDGFCRLIGNPLLKARQDKQVWISTYLVVLISIKFYCH